MVAINVTTNLSTVTKALDAFGKNQMPFAMSQALNDAAFEVRKDTIERVWPRSITQRNPAFMKAMLMPIRGDNRATKRRLRSIVQNYQTGTRNKDYLQRLAVGGIKRPNGNNIAIPANDMPTRAKGGVTIGNRPRNILNKPKVFKNRLPNGQEFIARRRTKKRYPLQMLYLLEPDGQVKKQFPFYEEAEKVGQRAFAQNFRKRFAQAKRTARRR